MKSELYKEIAIVAEVLGTDLSEGAAKYMATQLSQYDEGDINKALKRCANELKSKLTLAEILSRVDDGRPGPDEAWGALVWDEYQSAVLTEEMVMGQRAAWSLYDHDKVGARLAFKEAYISEVQKNRAEKRPVQWEVSLGWDQDGRLGVLKEAVKRGQISKDYAKRFIPVPKVGEILGALKSKQLQSDIKQIGRKMPDGDKG